MSDAIVIYGPDGKQMEVPRDSRVLVGWAGYAVASFFDLDDPFEWQLCDADVNPVSGRLCDLTMSSLTLRPRL